jgi:hypothetical protein
LPGWIPFKKTRNRSRRKEGWKKPRSRRSKGNERRMHSIRSELEDVNYKTQNLLRNWPTQLKPQVELQARKLQTDLATIRSGHLRDYNLIHIKVQTTINQTS